MLVNLRSELIINAIGWAFMHELNISFPLSLARFLLTQQLICQSKIEKPNVSLDIFVSDTSVGRNLQIPGVRTYILARYGPILLSLDQIPVFMLLKKIENQDLYIIKVKQYYIWEEYKQS